MVFSLDFLLQIVIENQDITVFRPTADEGEGGTSKIRFGVAEDHLRQFLATSDFYFYFFLPAIKMIYSARY